MEQLLFFSVFTLALGAISGFTALGAIVGLGATLFIKRVIISVALATPILFILANVWFRYTPNIFSQIFYTFTSYIGGVFVYWFIVSIIICGLFLLSQFFSIPLTKISIFFYGLATIIGFIGIAQAFFTRTVTYVVDTPTQYIELKGKRVALIADTHFGPVNQEMFAHYVVNKIIDTNPDAVLFAGDMFDGSDFDKSGVEKELKVLTDKIPVFFTPGNHEEYGPYSEFLASAKRSGMTVLVDEKADIFGAPIFGLNYRSIKNNKEIEDIFKTNGIGTTSPAIVINHEPGFQSVMQNAGVFLNVSGHTHGGQIWPGKYITQKIYGKYWYGLVKDRSFQSITTNGIGTFGPRMRTFNRGEVVIILFK
ncbi:MAG: metallophosphoesterase [Minisyncoccota bacterium]